MPGDTIVSEKDIEMGLHCSDTGCEMDRSLLDKISASRTALAESARFVPSYKDGKPNGVQIFAIRPGSVFAKIGMQDADFIKAVNGLDTSSLDAAVLAYHELQHASRLTFQIERHGKLIPLMLSFAK
jgi:general secretion pathway protein C